jgi:hypothetical protein
MISRARLATNERLGAVVGLLPILAGLIYLLLSAVG